MKTSGFGRVWPPLETDVVDYSKMPNCQSIFSSVLEFIVHIQEVYRNQVSAVYYSAYLARYTAQNKVGLVTE